MNATFQSIHRKLMLKWEQAVRTHQRWKQNPSAQCAWDLLKLTVTLVYYLTKLYIASH